MKRCIAFPPNRESWFFINLVASWYLAQGWLARSETDPPRPQTHESTGVVANVSCKKVFNALIATICSSKFQSFQGLSTVVLVNGRIREDKFTTAIRTNIECSL